MTLFNRKIIKFCHGALLTVLMCLAPSSSAFSSTNPELEQLNEKIQYIHDRLKKIEQENRDLKKQLESLENKTPQTPATPQRPERIPVPWKVPGEQKTPSKSPELASQPMLKARFIPGGAGFLAEGKNFTFRHLGYIQAQGSIFDSALNRPDGNGDFSVRRARFDFITTLYSDYTLFFEFDAGVGTVAAVDSDFSMVEGGIRIKLLEDSLQVAAGKFITTFSRENFRSSRSLDTIERYIALNSMFLLPALDAQFGVMAYGKLGKDKKLGYYLGVYNGNGLGRANLSDNNSDKEIQVRLTYDVHKQFRLGLAFDYSNEEPQTLSLADLGFVRYVSVPVNGERFGGTWDAAYETGRLSLRMEGLAFRFESPLGHVGLIGGFVQPGYFILGKASGGLETLVRMEAAHLDAPTGSNGDTLWGITPGINWFINSNVRLQANFTAHYLNGPSQLLGFPENRWTHLFQTQLQFRY